MANFLQGSWPRLAPTPGRQPLKVKRVPATPSVCLRLGATLQNWLPLLVAVQLRDEAGQDDEAGAGPAQRAPALAQKQVGEELQGGRAGRGHMSQGSTPPSQLGDGCLRTAAKTHALKGDGRILIPGKIQSMAMPQAPVMATDLMSAHSHAATSLTDPDAGNLAAPVKVTAAWLTAPSTGSSAYTMAASLDVTLRNATSCIRAAEREGVCDSRLQGLQELPHIHKEADYAC
jgi:hypothetical protein